MLTIYNYYRKIYFGKLFFNIENWNDREGKNQERLRSIKLECGNKLGCLRNEIEQGSMLEQMERNPRKFIKDYNAKEQKSKHLYWSSKFGQLF